MQVLFLFPGTALFIVCAGPYGNSHGGASVYAAGKQPRLLLLLKEPLERKINRTCVRAAERYAAARGRCVLGNTAQFTADALSVTSLADFPATVTKMLANTQSIRCAFCLTCQKTGRRDSALRIMRYCPKKTCLPARRMSGRANGFLTFSSGGPHVTAKRLLRRQP